jgi:hypothetical protein
VAQRRQPGADPVESTVYQIRLGGHLGQLWSDWFEGLAITWEGTDTLLTGTVADQAALHGLLRKVRDLGVPLVSVNRLGTGAEPDQWTTETGED